MSNLEKTKNPYNICIWDDKENCHNCPNIGKLQCHTDFHYTFWFMIGFLAFTIPIIIGFINLYDRNIVLFGFGLGLWISYLLFFFLVWEPRMLCSHCPNYAEGDAKILHCYGNYGFPKPVSFKPWPLSRSEQIQMVIGTILFVAIPIPFLWLGNQLVSLIIAILGFLFWLIILQTHICTHCLNFSCPWNRVSKEIVHDFLVRNPTMQNAWQKGNE